MLCQPLLLLFSRAFTVNKPSHNGKIMSDWDWELLSLHFHSPPDRFTRRVECLPRRQMELLTIWDLQLSFANCPLRNSWEQSWWLMKDPAVPPEELWDQRGWGEDIIYWDRATLPMQFAVTWCGLWGSISAALMLPLFLLTFGAISVIVNMMWPTPAHINTLYFRLGWSPSYWPGSWMRLAVFQVISGVLFWSKQNGLEVCDALLWKHDRRKEEFLLWIFI